MYEQHILQLAEELEVTVSFSSAPYRACYYPGRRFISTYPIRDYGVVPVPVDLAIDEPEHLTEQACYFTALHELGHAASGHVRMGNILQQEAEAWRWAIDNALVPMDKNTAQSALNALLSYGRVYSHHAPCDEWSATCAVLALRAVGAEPSLDELFAVTDEEQQYDHDEDPPEED